MARLLWKVAAVALVGLQGALTCSDFLLNATAGEGCLSGRTFDFEIDVNHEIGYMPEGSTLTLLPVCQGIPPAKLTTKHAFAFLASDRAVFKNISSVSSFHRHHRLMPLIAVSFDMRCHP